MEKVQRYLREPALLRARNKVGAWLLAGVLVVVPVGATVLIFLWLFMTIDSILQPIISQIFGHPVTGAGFAVTLALTLLAGVVADNVLGSRIIRYAESLLAKVPVFRFVYTGIKQVMESFSSPERSGFMRVVLVEFPRKDMMAMAFVTNESSGEPGKKLLSVFIPTAPNPTAGFLQMIREDKVIRTDVSIDEALKMVVSAGMRLPREVVDKLSRCIPGEACEADGVPVRTVGVVTRLP